MSTVPEVGDIYTLFQIERVLNLTDSPCLSFVYQGFNAVIQTSHVTKEQLLSVPGFGDTVWKYLFTTSEEIPVFDYVRYNRPIVDFEPANGSIYGAGEIWWVTPKGFPRTQVV